MLQSKLTVPMHYNTFEMIQIDPQVFVKEAGKHGCMVKVMTSGSTLEIE
jgi:L-ascorbate metabolism protein UlaG (beta-lactamase superfamily)